MVAKLINIILNILVFAFMGFLIHLYLKPEPGIEGQVKKESPEAQGD